MKRYQKIFAMVALLFGIATIPTVSLADSFVSIIGPSVHNKAYYDDETCIEHVGCTIQERSLNSLTFGLAYGYAWSNEQQIRVGAYFNSYRKPSFFGEYDYTPIHLGKIDLGVGGGLSTGYSQVTSSHAPIIPMGGLIARFDNIELRVVIDPIHHTQAYNISYRYFWSN